MVEYCICGIPKADHVDLLSKEMIGESVDAILKQVSTIQAKTYAMMMMYSNVCYNYRRDNLRYIEDLNVLHNKG